MKKRGPTDEGHRRVAATIATAMPMPWGRRRRGEPFPLTREGPGVRRRPGIIRKAAPAERRQRIGACPTVPGLKVGLLEV